MTRRPLPFSFRLAPAACALTLAAAQLSGPAFSEELAPAPAAGEFQAEPVAAPANPYAVPDLPPDFAQKTQLRTSWFTLSPGLVLIADYTAFSQDSASVEQVGRQTDQWDARSARLLLKGTVGSGYQASYLVAGEYKGFETDPDTTWELTDVSLTFPLPTPATKLTIGKTKETFAYEMVGDAANLPQQERILSPFFVSRSVGAKLTQVLGAEHRMTVSGGVFNDWWTSDDALDESGTDVSARVTGLLWDRNEGTRFLHLGLAGRYAGADRNTLRYRGRPESNVADNYVDSGNFYGDHAWHLGLELLWNEGPFSILAEYNQAWTHAPNEGDPTFNGYYITASWFITGETRPYDRTVGYARRVIPKGRWGAPELVARFSHVDIDDAGIRGGTFNKTYLGVNWWATRRWKFGAGWGHTWLDRFELDGNTDAFLARFQWVY